MKEYKEYIRRTAYRASKSTKGDRKGHAAKNSLRLLTTLSRPPMPFILQAACRVPGLYTASSQGRAGEKCTEGLGIRAITVHVIEEIHALHGGHSEILQAFVPRKSDEI